MNKRISILLLASVLLLVVVPVALAYTSASGVVKDANGNPWTHGGTVVCVQNSTQAQIGTGTVNPDGTWSVNLGSPAAATCTVDPAAGPAGNPASFTCAIPGGGGGGVRNYDCGAGSTGTGPNAVSLLSLGARSSDWGWAAATAVVIAGAFAWLRRR